MALSDIQRRGHGDLRWSRATNLGHVLIEAKGAGGAGLELSEGRKTIWDAPSTADYADDADRFRKKARDVRF